MPRRSLKLGVTISIAVLASLFLYIWIGSAGLQQPWPGYTSYYDEQAEAFRHGQLHLRSAPAPQLLAQANPYDARHSAFWRRDLSLYDGKYYTYWGPVPALLQAAVKTALQVEGIVGDQYLAFSFYCLCAVFGGALAYSMARRLFPDLPLPLATLGALTVALANPGPYLVATGGVYQAAIAGGQAFLMLGLLFAFQAICKTETAIPTTPALLAAGLAWALALGCRVTLAPTIGLLCIATILAAAFGRMSPFKKGIQAGLSLGVPLAIGSAALLFYNYLRFDSWLEFGVNKLLTTLPFNASRDYWGINLYSYSLRPLNLSCSFPFVSAPWGAEAIHAPSILQVPAGYITEPIAGLLWAVPCIVLAPPAFIRGWSLLRRTWQVQQRRLGSLGLRPRLYLWCVLSFAISGTVTGTAWMGLYLASMRYLADITLGLVLLGVLGGWTLYSKAPANSAHRRLGGVVIAGAGVITISVGLLLGYQGYNNHFARFNPTLHQQATRALSLCQHR